MTVFSTSKRHVHEECNSQIMNSRTAFGSHEANWDSMQRTCPAVSVMILSGERSYETPSGNRLQKMQRCGTWKIAIDCTNSWRGSTSGINAKRQREDRRRSSEMV
jgi:hypothetical protein